MAGFESLVSDLSAAGDTLDFRRVPQIIARAMAIFVYPWWLGGYQWMSYIILDILGNIQMGISRMKTKKHAASANLVGGFHPSETY